MVRMTVSGSFALATFALGFAFATASVGPNPVAAGSGGAHAAPRRTVSGRAKRIIGTGSRLTRGAGKEAIQPGGIAIGHARKNDAPGSPGAPPCRKQISRSLRGVAREDQLRLRAPDLR